MKIRLGFVTNSSSSSFVCFGLGMDEINLPDEILLEIFQSEFERRKKRAEENPEHTWAVEYFDRVKDISDLKEKLEWAKEQVEESPHQMIGRLSSILEVGGYDNDVVGITIENFISKYPDLTLEELKKVVVDEANRIFGTNYTEDSVGYFEMVWSDY